MVLELTFELCDVSLLFLTCGSRLLQLLCCYAVCSKVRLRVCGKLFYRVLKAVRGDQML